MFYCSVFKKFKQISSPCRHIKRQVFRNLYFSCLNTSNEEGIGTISIIGILLMGFSSLDDSSSSDDDDDTAGEEADEEGENATAVTRFLIKRLPKQLSKLRNDKAELEERILDLEQTISNQNQAMLEMERRVDVYKKEAETARKWNASLSLNIGKQVRRFSF